MKQGFIILTSSPIKDGWSVKTPERKRYFPKEWSWLDFNARVLQEAANPALHPVDRIKFLGIFSNNLDEFYRVRVANLQRLVSTEGPSHKVMGHPVSSILKGLRHKVLEQVDVFNHVYQEILRDLEKSGVILLDEKHLSPEQEQFVEKYFSSRVRPRLFPLMLDQVSGSLRLRDQFLYMAVQWNQSGGAGERRRYALIEVPTDSLPRFVSLPASEGRQCVILLEDVIRWGLHSILSLFLPSQLEAWSFKVTRDAELELGNEVTESFIKRINDSLRKRQSGAPVRMVYDSDIPPIFLKTLLKRTGMERNENLVPGERCHNFKDFMRFPELGRPASTDFSPTAIAHPDLRQAVSVFSVLAHKDVLLHFPYHSFTAVVDFLREAAIDPKVTHIRLTVYRVASKHSSILNALINAVRNGKKVTVLLEILARFDEENNIYWTERLRAEGVQVIIGVRGLKVHSKLCLVTRREGSKVTHFATIGTGNFNEDTARIYTDHILMTSKSRITEEVLRVFDFFKNNYQVYKFKELLVSPFNARSTIVKLLREEIHNAKNGRKAWLCAKLNNLVDEEIIDLLYRAAHEGVKIRLIVRGMLSLNPHLPETKGNLEVISIVGRYLEHSRFFIFAQDGKPVGYITSGDWMTRNLDQRVEVACPLRDPTLLDQLKNYFEIQWRDTVKARICDIDGSNRIRPVDGTPLEAQNEIHNWLQELAQPPV